MRASQLSLLSRESWRLLQLLALRVLHGPAEGTVLLVGNTHLHSHSEHQDVRLLQTALCLARIEGALRQLRQRVSLASRPSIYVVLWLSCSDAFADSLSSSRGHAWD